MIYKKTSSIFLFFIYPYYINTHFMTKRINYPLHTLNGLQVNQNALFIDNNTSHVGIGTSSPSYPLHVSGSIFSSSEIFAFSDIRVKKDVYTIQSALSKTLQLRGVNYTNIMNDTKNIGVVAQEVETIIPDVVSTDNHGYKSVAYGNIVGLLIEAIKEMSAKHDAEISVLKKEISQLKNNL